MSYNFAGHHIVAATASIPSRYQTVITNNADQKGFLSKSKRFSHEMTSVSIAFNSIDLLTFKTCKQSTWLQTIGVNG